MGILELFYFGQEERTVTSRLAMKAPIKMCRPQTCLFFMNEICRVTG